MRSANGRPGAAALAAMIYFGLLQGAHASAISDWQDSLQRRAEGLVKAVTGASNVYVFAKLNLETLGSAEDNVDRLFRPTGTTGEILPGISKDDIAPHMGRADVYTLGDRQDRTVRIRSVELLITVPTSVSAQRVNMIKTRLPSMLGFTPRDSLVVEQIAMAGTWERSLERLGEVLPLLLIGFLLALGLTALFAAGPLKTVIREIRRARPPSDEGPPVSRGSRAGLSPANPPVRLVGMPALSGVAPANGGSPHPANGEKPLFAFITEENLPKVIHLLSTEPPELLAYIASSVQPATAVPILNSLPAEKRNLVIKELTDLHVHEPDTVRAMARRLSERVSCVSGGVERLGELFWEMDQATQDSYLKMLEKSDPKTAGEIRRRLIAVDDVFADDPATLRQVLWESYRQGDLARLLRTRSVPEQKKALAALPASLQRVVEEDLAGLAKEPADSEKDSQAEKGFLLIARKLMSPAIQNTYKKGNLS